MILIDQFTNVNDANYFMSTFSSQIFWSWYTNNLIFPCGSYIWVQGPSSSSILVCGLSSCDYQIPNNACSPPPYPKPFPPPSPSPPSYPIVPSPPIPPSPPSPPSPPPPSPSPCSVMIQMTRSYPFKQTDCLGLQTLVPVLYYQNFKDTTFECMLTSPNIITVYALAKSFAQARQGSDEFGLANGLLGTIYGLNCNTNDRITYSDNCNNIEVLFTGPGGFIPCQSPPPPPPWSPPPPPVPKPSPFPPRPRPPNPSPPPSPSPPPNPPPLSSTIFEIKVNTDTSTNGTCSNFLEALESYTGLLETVKIYRYTCNVTKPTLIIAQVDTYPVLPISKLAIQFLRFMAGEAVSLPHNQSKW